MDNNWPSQVGVNVNNQSEATSDDDSKKKLAHKEIEKQRRLEMSSLHVSLRSLLPLQYIKGKRSMSDHMNGAVEYINDLKNRIRNLSEKRDGLKRVLNSNNWSESSGSRSEIGCSCVMVKSCLVGLEIVISCHGESVVLSRALDVLVHEGLDVVSCLSSKVNQNQLLITIQTKVSDVRYIDETKLEEKLNEVIRSSP